MWEYHNFSIYIEFDSILFNSKLRLKLREKMEKKVGSLISMENAELSRTIEITASYEQCNLSVYTGRRDNLC